MKNLLLLDVCNLDKRNSRGEKLGRSTGWHLVFSHSASQSGCACQRERVKNLSPCLVSKIRKPEPAGLLS